MFLCSAIVALAIRIIILTLPLFYPSMILNNVECLEHEQNENATWMNMYIRLLERNNKNKFYLLATFLLMLIFYSLICNQGMETATMILFGKSIPMNLNRSYIMY